MLVEVVGGQERIQTPSVVARVIYVGARYDVSATACTPKQMNKALPWSRWPMLHCPFL